MLGIVEIKMPRCHMSDPPRFRQQILQLARADSPQNELVYEFPSFAVGIRYWFNQDRNEAGQRSSDQTSVVHNNQHYHLYT